MRYLTFTWREIVFTDWWDVYFTSEDPLEIRLRVTYLIGRVV
jgi:hypothetical protein